MQQVVIDQIRGVIYGQAVGDALGLGAEFLTKTEVKQYYPYGLKRYGAIIRDSHRRRWKVGAWTDDTDQMLCILDSLFQKKSVDVLDIAHRLYQWVAQGGMGIGRTVLSVLSEPDFLSAPQEAAKRVWERSGQDAAANGGVMRTSILGIWEYPHLDRVKHNAEQVCQITHYDPRCVGSCVVVCLTISSLLHGQYDVDSLFRQASIEAHKYDGRIEEYLDRAHESLEALDLDEGLNPETGDWGKIGYTLKTMGAGLWALKHAPSFMEGILSIIYEGGDADSNAAVAGALLGAKFGFSQLPSKLVDGLADKPALDQRVEQLLGLVLPSSFVFRPSSDPQARDNTMTLSRLVVLISGSGTNLQALLNACASGELSAQVAAVVSNHRDAYGLVRARKAGVPAEYLPFAQHPADKPYRDLGRQREEYDRDLADLVERYQPDLIVLAGWMQILTPVFINRFPGRLINLHPALPGQFPGTHGIERAFDAYQRGEITHSGVMIHHVVPEVDAGEVVASVVVPILPTDTLADYEARVHDSEHVLIVRAVKDTLAKLESLCP